MSVPLIQIVDENDNPVGQASIEEAQSKGLHHRIVRVIVESEDGTALLLQKRSTSMTTYPDCWDQSVGGHVDAGESYEEAAKRELYEELGVRAEIEEIGSYVTDSNFGSKILNRFNKVYRTVIPADTFIKPQDDEVSEVEWIGVKDLDDFINNNPDKITDGLQYIWTKYYSR